MKEMKKKLIARRGESIAETLVALLIAAVSLVMLASMITSTVNLVSRSRITMEKYYKVNNVLESGVNDQPADAPLTSGTVKFELRDKNDSATSFGAYDDIPFYQNDTFGQTPVIAYAIPTPAPVSTPDPFGGGG